MRAEAPRDKPNCGYIAITFSWTATCGRKDARLWGHRWGQADTLGLTT